jgi:hypothetical protein
LVFLMIAVLMMYYLLQRLYRQSRLDAGQRKTHNDTHDTGRVHELLFVDSSLTLGTRSSADAVDHTSASDSAAARLRHSRSDLEQVSPAGAYLTPSFIWPPRFDCETGCELWG